MNISLLKNLSYTKLINITFILYAFSIPLSRAGISLFSILLILFWLLEGDFKRKFLQIKNNNFLFTGILFLGYIILTTLWSDNLVEVWEHFKRTWYYLVMLVIFTSVKQEFTEKAIIAFLSAIFISVLISYGMAMELIVNKHGTSADPTPFMNHLEYSILLAMASLISLKEALFSNQIKTKVIYISLFLLITIDLFITEGRIGHLAFAIGLFIFIMNYFKHKFLAIILSLFTLFTLFLGIYSSSSSFQSRMSTSINSIEHISNKQYNSSFGLRIVSWKTTIDILTKNPLIGIGIGDVSDTTHQYVLSNNLLHTGYFLNTITGSLHSDLLEIAMGGGFIAVILFLLSFYYLSRLKLYNNKFNDYKYILVSVFLIAQLGDTFFRLQFTENLFILFAGIILVASNNSRKEPF